MSGELSVSAPVGFATSHLGRALAPALKAHAGLSLRLVATDDLLDLMRERIDIAITIGTTPPAGSLTRRHLADWANIIVAAPGYLEARGTPRTAEDLAGHDFVALPSWHHGADVIAGPDGRRHRLTMNRRATSNNQLTLKELAIAGCGLCLKRRARGRRGAGRRAAGPRAAGMVAAGPQRERAARAAGEAPCEGPRRARRAGVLPVAGEPTPTGRTRPPCLPGPIALAITRSLRLVDSASNAAFRLPQPPCSACVPRMRPRARAGGSVPTARHRVCRPPRPPEPCTPALRVRVQSENRHPFASSAMSSNAPSTADSSTHGCSSRMPGVSISNAPPGNSTSCRAVVVWRPLPSLSRTSPTCCRSCPSSRFTTVNFPTPEDPSNATVVDGWR